MNIRKGDTVEVIAGADKGSRGTVLSVDLKHGKVVVEGVHKVHKHALSQIGGTRFSSDS